MPGYTQDTRPPGGGGTGFTDDMSSVSSYLDLYNKVVYRPENYLRVLQPYGRGLHSSTLQLNVSRF
jgi:hypothetical protein